MASEEPDETPAQVKERKAREKAYRKERGAKWNYVSWALSSKNGDEQAHGE